MNRFKKEEEQQEELKRKKELGEKGEKETKGKEFSIKDLLAGMENKEESSNFTFYLRKNNMKKLKTLASKKKISVSKLLDNILTEILRDE